MKLPKSINSEQDERSGIKSLGRFLFRHSEKIAAGIMVLVALWFAVKGKDYKLLDWAPNELEELVDKTEEIIKSNKHSAVDKQIKIFDYATYAEQIRERIPSEPYRSESAWRPVLQPDRQPWGTIDILTAESLEGEAARRTGSMAKGMLQERWKRPPLPGSQSGNPQTTNDESSIWINLYGTIPLRKQWDIYNLASGEAIEASRPEYVYYELEKAELPPKGDLIWHPVIVYPDGLQHSDDEFVASQNFDLFRDRLIPLEQSVTRQADARVLLFSDFKVEPAKTYVYRIRLYLANPNYNMQETYVAEGVDTTSRYVRSDWGTFSRVYVPNRTTVRLQSVTPADRAEFPRQQGPLGGVRGTVTVLLDYFDMDLGLFLPSVEKKDVPRGTLCNVSKDDANRYINRIKTSDGTVNINYPDTGLRSDVCIMDFCGGKKLQKKVQSSSDMFVTGKALLLMPDGTMQSATTTPELIWE